MRFAGNSSFGSPVPPSGSPSTETSHLEIAHVLFMDMVGYSRLRRDQQAAVQEELTRLVNSIEEVEKARRNALLIARPSGDGMSLLFFQNMLSPVHTALEVDRLLKINNPTLEARIGAPIRLRMGIHSGPILIVKDINGAVDVAGEGIVEAQRVMDAGDAGHILLSANVAEGLQGMQPWSRFIHSLGEYHDKNGKKIDLFTLVGQMPGYPSFGREDTPKKVLADRARVHQRRENITQELEAFEKQDKKRSYLRAAGMAGSAILMLGLSSLMGLHSSQDSFSKALSPAPPTPVPTPQSPFIRSAELIQPESHRTPNGLPQGHGVRDERNIRVPSVMGLTMDQAQLQMEAVGLKIERSELNPVEFSSQYGYGLICRQSPSAGTRVSPDEIIYIRESQGPSPRPTPDPTDDQDETSQTAQPAPTPAPVHYTGILIDARRQLGFDSRGPFTVLDNNGGEIIGTMEYGVYDDEKGNESGISRQVGQEPYRCVAANIKWPSGLILNAEDSARLRKMVKEDSDNRVHIGILCQIR